MCGGAKAEEAEEAAAPGIVKAGPGGYRTTRPEPCQPLPAKIQRTASAAGRPMLTNQWWSSLVWNDGEGTCNGEFSNSMFPHPLAVRCEGSGLSIWYPGSHIKGDRPAIMGAGGVDMTIGHSASPRFGEALCDGFSDWFVTAAFGTGDSALLSATFGHGSPYVYFLYEGGDPVVRFRTGAQVWAGSEREAVLGVTTNGRHYGLFGATGSTWTGLDENGNAFTNRANGKPYFAVAVLPDATVETLSLFRRYAYTHVTDSWVEYEIREGTLASAYQYTTKVYEGAEKETLFALYPHQWKYTGCSALTDLSYRSVRGEMKLGAGQSFSTAVPVLGILPLLPPQGIKDKHRMLKYLEAEANKKPGGIGDTYWEGKHLGKLATLSGVAEAAGAPGIQKVFIAELKRRLEQWFTATPDKEQPVFYYDSNWGTLTGSRPSYGSDEQLNDHHFHMGYFIRAAAEIARVDLAWAKEWAPMVRLLIRDIASPDRDDPMFPFLRCFDKYAGHSWASGHANFGDGNNQESSSESMNAWYAMAMWGQVTGDAQARNTGLALFNTERIAVEEYWFDISGENFPDDFPNVALGMVWGGKGAFGTWFSGDIDCIHGINWLPFTPASLYMGRFPDYLKKNHDRIVEVRKGGADYNNGWGDLVVMFYAQCDPAAAARYIDTNSNCIVEAGNTHAFMAHWIHTLECLGRYDYEVTSNYPFHGVFRKGNLRTYVAYNYGTKPQIVKFSDHFELIVPPRKLCTRGALIR